MSAASSSAAAAISSDSCGASGFLSSTHAQWLYHTTAELNTMREHARRPALKRIAREKARAELNAAAAAAQAADRPQTPPPAQSATSDAMLISPAHAPAAASAAVGKEKKSSSTASMLKEEPLSTSEEQQLRQFYTDQVLAMANALNLPSNVTHTAAIFFKRFFLRTSVLEYSPKEIAYCSLFLACKAEEYSLSGSGRVGDREGLDRMLQIIQAKARAGKEEKESAKSKDKANTVTGAMVLALEVPMLTHLRFHMRIYHIARSLRGLVREFETLDTNSCALALFINQDQPVMTEVKMDGGRQVPSEGTSLQSVSSFFTGPRSTALAQQVLLSDDLIFLYSPSQIALALAQQLQSEVKKFAIEKHLDSSTKSSHAASNQLPNLRIVESFIEAKAKPLALKESATWAKLKGSSKPVNISQRILDILKLMEEGRVQAEGRKQPDYRKTLKQIESRRKTFSNALLDSTSKEFKADQEARARAKEEAAQRKAQQQREASQKRQADFLMSSSPDNSPSAASAAPAESDGSEFLLRKRSKSAHGTPNGTGSSPSPSPASARLARQGANLASQFDAEMEG